MDLSELLEVTKQGSHTSTTEITRGLYRYASKHGCTLECIVLSLANEVRLRKRSEAHLNQRLMELQSALELDSTAARYKSTTTHQAISHMLEECGEVVAAAGKTFCRGLNGFNTELPTEGREPNRDWLLRELKDLKRAIIIAEKFIREDRGDVV